jgi:hypothetical protein
MQRMSTRTHGLIDYVTGMALVALPNIMPMGKIATALFRGAGGAAAVYSALTNYERGLYKVLPMKAHLTLDALSGGLMLGAAAMLDDEDAEVRATMVGVGLFEIAAAVMTETRPVPEQAGIESSHRHGQLYQGSMQTPVEPDAQTSPVPVR